MLRVLHLYPVQHDFQTRRCLEHLTRNPDPEFSVISKSIGLGGDLHHLPAAVIALRSVQADIAHVWGSHELAAAALAGFQKIIFTPSAAVVPRWFGWLDKFPRRPRVDVVCPTQTLRGLFIAAGIASNRCHLVRPAIDSGRLALGRNPRLRAELGFGDCEDVLLAPGESTRDGGHRQAIWAAAILNVLDPRYRLLTWGRGQAVESLRRFARSLRQARVLVQAERRLGRRIEFEELASVADAALIFARGIVPTLPIAVCMASGLPIVSNLTSTLAEILEDGRTALAVAEATPRMIAQRLLDLRRNPAGQSQITEAARAQALGQYSAPRFLAEYKNIYCQMAADKIV